MPNVEASRKDLQKLIGKKLDDKQLEEAIEFAIDAEREVKTTDGTEEIIYYYNRGIIIKFISFLGISLISLYICIALRSYGGEGQRKKAVH